VLQRPQVSRSGSVTAADTNAHQFTAQPAMTVQFYTDSNNTGTVKILGVSPAGTVDSDGPPLAAGTWSPTFVVQDMKQLAYKFSVGSTDKLYWISGA